MLIGIVSLATKYPMALVISFALLEFVGNIDVDGKLSSSVRWLSSCGTPLLAARFLVEAENSPVDFFVAQTWHKRVDELLLNELPYL